MIPSVMRCRFSSLIDSFWVWFSLVVEWDMGLSSSINSQL